MSPDLPDSHMKFKLFRNCPRVSKQPQNRFKFDKVRKKIASNLTCFCCCLVPDIFDGPCCKQVLSTIETTFEICRLKIATSCGRPGTSCTTPAWPWDPDAAPWSLMFVFRSHFFRKWSTPHRRISRRLESLVGFSYFTCFRTSLLHRLEREYLWN